MVMIQPIAINSSSAFVVVACAPEFETVVDVVVKVVSSKFAFYTVECFMESIFGNEYIAFSR